MTSWKRRYRSYGTPPTRTKTIDDVVLDRRQRGDPLCLDSEVVGRSGSGEPRGVLGRERESSRLGIELCDASRRHSGEPLAYVAFVESGCVRKLFARRRAVLCKGVEEARSMPNGSKHHQRPAVQHVQHPLGEGFRPSLVVRSRHDAPLSFAVRASCMVHERRAPVSCDRAELAHSHADMC